ncbi:MAG: hypothetical protein HQL36_03125 [Alphaproteobacteria bacterium]|nr:hypothetical protein [Alphaproteobacteria bacterium]MBF0249585.1 hypothetical protein [Alphaproteobacteria bacterium]
MTLVLSFMIIFRLLPFSPRWSGHHKPASGNCTTPKKRGAAGQGFRVLAVAGRDGDGDADTDLQRVSGVGERLSDALKAGMWNSRGVQAYGKVNVRC